MGLSRICLGLLFLICASVAPVFADSVQVQYTVTGTFSSSVGSAPLSGPNGDYSMNFALPQMPAPDYVDATAGDFAIFNVPISYSFQSQGGSSATSFSGTAEEVEIDGPRLGGKVFV